MTIRPPRESDVEAIVAMGERMHRESAYGFLPYDSGKVARLVRAFVHEPEVYGGFVAEDAALLGMIGGYVSDYFFCDEKVVSDMIFFVERPYRGGSAAARLIRAFTDWAIERGAREMCLGISTGIHTEKTGRFYEHLGFSPAGALYKRRLDQHP